MRFKLAGLALARVTLRRRVGRSSGFRPSISKHERLRIRNRAGCPDETSAHPQLINGRKIVFIRRCVGPINPQSRRFTEVYALTLGETTPNTDSVRTSRRQGHRAMAWVAETVEQRPA